MAASEPAPGSVHSWTEDVQSSDPVVDTTKGLEMGMSGMSLVSAAYSNGPERKETESTMDSSSPGGHDYGQPPPPPPPPHTYGDHPHSETGSVTAPMSPGSDRQQQQQQHAMAMSSSKGGGVATSTTRPPGITVAPLPSPIGKPGHSKNTSATSPLLTLTPNSSVDGNSDWHSIGARLSPSFQASDVQVPTLPFLNNADQQQRHRGGGGGGGGGYHGDDGAHSLGSFEIGGQDNDNDGLLGLEALRDRAYSSPGPVQMVSTSPPVMRGHFPAHSSASSTASASSSHHEGQLERPRPRERPPLSSYSHQLPEGSSNQQGDNRAYLPHAVPPTRNAGPSDPSNVSFESNDSRTPFGGALGAIGRPELRQVTSDFDVTNSRRRASSQDNHYQQQQHNPYMMQQQQQQQQQNGGMQDPSQKFGSLPSLTSHIQQQRMPDNMAELPRPRHVRSVSTPMPANCVNTQQLPAGMDAHQYQAAMQMEGHSYPGENKYKPSASQPSLSSSYDSSQQQYAHQKRVSMPNLGGNQQQGYGGTQQQGYGGAQQQGYGGTQQQGYGGNPGYHQNYARRDGGMEYQMNHQGAVVASAEEMRGGYPGSSMISPGHSPMQAHYSSGHSRHSTEGAGSAMLSSSPRSLGGMSRGSMGSMLPPPVYGGDEDLTHPLVGEHIDVPAEHDDMYSANSYNMSQQGLPHGMQQRRGHSQSMDQMLPQFIETPHHLPTAGAALPMPKVVYAVKFKRTQRNFVLGPRINRDLKIGTYVKVEADRGEDLGIVVGKLPAEKYNFSSGRGSFSSVTLGAATAGMGGGDLKRIIRLATHDEVALLTLKRDEEEELLKICRAKVRQRGLPMHVVDAEYQFDRHKLTFFFEAEGRVDFRELVRDLFSMYKTRIWMQQLDKNTATSSPAFTAPHPSTLQIDYGTPIIAPVSEFADSIVLGGFSAGDGRSH